MAKEKRVYQIAERIRHLVSMQLQRVSDPRFSLVSVTSVVVSKDLRHAKVYWAVSSAPGGGDPERKSEVEEAFESAKGLFRRAIAAELGIRFVPEMKFFFDDTFETVDKVERLFQLIDSRSTEIQEGPLPDENSRELRNSSRTGQRITGSRS